MAVITLTVVPSETQLISGIPKTITLETNTPAIIFYTLDGSEPTESSTVYTAAITLPTMGAVRLRAFAKSGADQSSELDITYAPNIMNQKYPRSKVTFDPTQISYSFLIGDASVYLQPATYERTNENSYGLADKPQPIGDGYDADGYFPKATYTEEIPMFSQKYSELDVYGQNIGKLPAHARVVFVPPPPETTSANSPFFNPKAMVTYIDGSQETEVLTVLRPYYFDTDASIYNWGGMMSSSYTNDGGMLTTGSSLIPQYNPKTNTVTYYYRDSISNRWIVCVQPITREAMDARNVPGALLSQGFRGGGGVVLRWLYFKGTNVI